MPHRSKTFAMLGVLALGACAPARPAPTDAGLRAATAKNVIFMVADGAGVAYWSAAKLAGGDLAVERMPVVGLVQTRSATSHVTDSAAGATVFATGIRVDDRTVGVAPGCRALLRQDSMALKRDPSGCEPLESVFEVARRQGMATGVVTTTEVVDATPAAFVAHSPSRYWSALIAEQFASAGLAVLLGGGRQHFDGSAGGADLLSGICARSACVSSAAELAAYRPDDRPLVGLFTPGDLGIAGVRTPSLPRMVQAALARLSRDPEGFVAVFETEGTDHSGHSNEPVESITAEVLEFDRAVAEALEFARRDGQTLVIVTADHETGGLTLVAEGGRVVAKYSTADHTAALVPLFAYGPGAERFGGMRENTEIGEMLKRVVATRR